MFERIESKPEQPELSAGNLVSKVLTLRARVRTILQRYPEARNYDKFVVIHYLEDYSQVILPPEVKNLLMQTSFKSIITQRQNIQQFEPELEPTDPKIREKRKRMSEAVKRAHRLRQGRLTNS